MAVAGDVKRKIAVLQFPFKAGGTQPQRGAHRTAPDRHAPHLHCLHAAGAIPDRIFQPAFLVPGEIGRGDLRQQLFLQRRRGKVYAAVIIGDGLLGFGGIHWLQVGQIVLPHLSRSSGQPCGAGMEHRQNRNAAIEDSLPIGRRHRITDLFLISVRLCPPVGPGLLHGDIRLTAGRVCADVRRVPVAAAGCQLVKGIGPGCHRLSLQRLLCKGGGHLRRRDAHQILRQRHFPHSLSVQHPQGPVRVINSLYRRLDRSRLLRPG